jgi:acetyl esterase/lipase
MHTLAYGPGPDQIGDLYLPGTANAAMVCLLHGGFWRMPYGREELSPIAHDLCGSGFAVWNLEYRRVGPEGHPWPATFRDIEAALAHLPALRQAHPQLDLRRLFLVGHSAGGHLAFWAAAQTRRAGPVHPAAVIGLAPLLDLVAVHRAGLGNNAVEAFLGGPPAAVPERYQEASPHALLPLHLRQLVLHGDADAAVPLGLSHAYVEAARRAGDDATCIALAGTDHMAFLDPQSEAHRVLRQCLSTAV